MEGWDRVNVYYFGTGQYVYPYAGKRTGPGNAPIVGIKSGVLASIAANTDPNASGTKPGSPTPTGGWNATSVADGSIAVDISSQPIGTWDLWLKIPDPDNAGRYDVEWAGTFIIQ
jgi:hypothetical protein